VAYGNASTPAITPAPTTSRSILSGIITSGSPTACYNTDFVGVILGAYSGLSTDQALLCQCLTQLSDWLSTTDPGTHTLTRSIPDGVTTVTETTGGVTTTLTTEIVYVETVTVTENNAGADGDFWYGSATSPCVSARIYSNIQGILTNLLFSAIHALSQPPRSKSCTGKLVGTK
jgi:hypothetical protein